MKFEACKLNLKSLLFILILTFFIVLISHEYWFVPNPIKISFNVKADNIPTISVELNKKYDDDFRESKSENLSEKDIIKDSNINLYVKNISLPKKIRINFSSITSNQPITISNLKIEGTRSELVDLTKMQVECADIIYSSKSTLTLCPNGIIVQLTYNKQLDISSNSKINFKRLILVFVLSFLFFSLLFNYILKDKDSKTDTIFRVLFILFLFVPMIHIDNLSESKKENRTLAQWHPLFDENKEINSQFLYNFNEWFNDQFFLRQIMCDLNTKIRFFIASKIYENSSVFIDKHNQWMFSSLIQESIPEVFKDNLIKFNDLCKKNNIKLYVLVIPRKEAVYQELVGVRHRENFLLANDFFESIKKNNDIKVIYPYKELRDAAKDDYVFFKSDHHLTDYGMFITYKALVKEIKKDFPDFKESEMSDFDKFEHNNVRIEYGRTFKIGNSINKLNLEPDFDIKYGYLNHKNFNDIEIFNNINFKNRVFKYIKSKNKLKAVLVGDSMTESLSYIMSHDFLELKKVRTNNGLADKQDQMNITMLQRDCIQAKPDIIIMNISVEDLEPVVGMYN